MPSRPPLGPVRRMLTRVLLDGRAPVRLLTIIHARMRADEVWHAHYHALRSVEQASARREFGPAQTDLVERMIMANLPPERSRRPLVGLLATAGAAAALLLLVDFDDREASAWTERGTAEHAVGVRVRCVDRAAQAVVAEAEVAPSVARGGLGCPRGGLLSFSVTNRSDEERHVFVVGISAAGDLRWYAPFVEGASSAPMAAGAIDELLPVVADTSGMPADARVTLHAIFSDRALTGAEVALLVRGAAARGVSVGALERLPVPGVQQGRLELTALAEVHKK